MKLSKQTIAILKNFSNINSGIQFKVGNCLRTVSNQKNILAKSFLEENFPQDFAIYDLPQFLSVLSLAKEDIELEFDDKNVIIYTLGRRSKTFYRGCLPNMIVIPPEKEISMPSAEVTFKLSESDFKWILNSSSVLGSPNICVTSSVEGIKLVSNNIHDNSAHVQELNMKEKFETPFNFIFKTENLAKILLGSYDVEISSKGIAHFVNTNVNLEYFITTETGSSFG